MGISTTIRKLIGWVMIVIAIFFTLWTIISFSAGFVTVFQIIGIVISWLIAFILLALGSVIKR